jgi:hypothetical protein
MHAAVIALVVVLAKYSPVVFSGCVTSGLVCMVAMLRT